MSYRESVMSLKILKDLYKNRASSLSLFKSLENSSQISLENFSIHLQTIKNQEETSGGSPNSWDKSGEKSVIDLGELFSESFGSRKLLILGSPGIGKTSLLQYILYKWNREQLWNEKFECVYLIKLRILLNNGWQREYSGVELKENLLKCFVHYNIVMYSNEKRDPNLRLDNLYWPKDKSKVLLLIDGYDEIKELREKEDFTRLEKEIALHKNLIVTSKSNALDDRLKSQFDRTIEVVGLDRSQIESIIEDYFRSNDESRAKGLKAYLVENPSLEELCKVAINLQMLCFLWKQDEPTRIPSSLSQLYEETVNVISRRYFKEAENKNVDLDELTLLSFIAFQITTGGEKKRLVFEGVSDENEVSIQWCIDELIKQGEIKEEITIRDVYNFGLLEIQKPGLDMTNKELDLSRETFSFVHECFQDYFTAHYLVRTLIRNKEEEGSNLYEFIALRRNEPEYLMILKLMAGLIYNLEDDQPRKQEVSQAFWDAMTCNIDGVIELGIEAKVELFMHLLSQIEKEDAEIVHIRPMRSLIDGVVLSEILEWKNELKESGYMSKEIKEGLLGVLRDGNVEWSLKRVREISDRSEGVMKATLRHLVKRRTEPFSKIVISKNNTSLGRENMLIQSVDVVSDLLEKFSFEEQQEVILEGYIKAFQEASEDREVKRRVIAAIGKLVLLNSKGCLERKDELLEILIPSIFDKNLENLALKASGNLIHASKAPKISYEILCRMRSYEQGNEVLEHLVKCFDVETANYALKELIQMSDDMTDEDLKHVIRVISLILAYQPKAEEVPHAVEVLTSFLTHISGGIRNEAKAGLKGIRAPISVNDNIFRARDQVLMLLNKDAPQELDDLSMILKKITTTDQEQIVRTIYSFIDEYQEERLSSPLKMNATKAISNLIDSVKDQDLAMKIKSRWIRFLHEEDENVKVQAIKALLKWFDKTKNLELVQDILSILPNLFEDESNSGYIRKTAVECLEHLAGFITEKSLQKRILRRMIKMSSDEDRAVRHEAQRGILSMLRIHQDKELLEVARKGLINLLQQERNGEIIQEICSKDCVGNFLRMNFDEKLAGVAIENLLLKSNLQDENVAIVIDLIKMAPQTSLPPNIALDSLYKVLNTTEDIKIKERAANAIAEIIKAISDVEVPQDIIKRLHPLLQNQEKYTIEIFGKILEAREDYTLANEAIKILLPLMQQQREQEDPELQISLAKAINHAISQGARVNEQDLVKVQIELQYSEIFHCVEAMKQSRIKIARWAHDQPKISRYANAYVTAIKALEALYKDKEEQLMSVSKLSDMIGFHEVRVVEAIEALITLIYESSQVLNITEDFGYKEIVSLAVKLIRSTGNRRLAGSVVERLVGFMEKSDVENGVILKTIVEITKTFMLSRKDLRRLLENTRLRVSVKEGLGEAFEELVEKKLKVLDEMVNYEGVLKVRTINGKLFNNRLKREIQGQLEDGILEIKHQGGSLESRQELQRIILRELNQMEDMNFYELIEMALIVIGYQENDLHQRDREQAKRLLDYQIKWMEMEGLTYVNENFEYLAGLSKDSRFFFGKLFHKILKDFDISLIKEELLVGLINEGLVITIHREGKVCSEGQVYTVQDQQKLEKILKTVIYQEQDALTLQYKQHEPLFKNSESVNGMKKAAIDVGNVMSIVENSYELTEKNWLLSKLKGDDGQVLLILEQRNILGDHIIYEVNHQKLFKMHPLDLTTEKLTEIIGEYKGQEAYYGTSKKIDVTEGSLIMKEKKSGDFENISGEKIGTSKMYFHDELIRSSKNDRLVFEMKTNLDDSARRFETELQLQGLSENNKEKLLDYYKAFTRTFEDAYVASQAILNNESVINTAETRGSSILTNVIVSTPTKSPQKRFSEMESMGEYVKNQTMMARAKRILQIGTDMMSFDQVVGELAFQTTLDQRKQDQILSLEEEKGGNVSGKEEKVISFYKKMQGEGRQQFEEGSHKKTSESLLGKTDKQKNTSESLLGKTDAQIAIEDWISQKGMISEQREKIVSVGSIQSQLLQKKVGAQQVRNGLRELDNRQCCCQIF